MSQNFNTIAEVPDIPLFSHWNSLLVRYQIDSTRIETPKTKDKELPSPAAPQVIYTLFVI